MNQSLIGLFFVLVILQIFRGGDLGHSQIGLGAPRAVRLLSLPAKVVVDLVLRNDPQPAAKGILGKFLAKRGNLGRDRLEDVLEHVGRVLVREGQFATPVVDERCVQQDQAIPGGRVIGFDSTEKTQGSRVRVRFRPTWFWLLGPFHQRGTFGRTRPRAPMTTATQTPSSKKTLVPVNTKAP